MIKRILLVLVGVSLFVRVMGPGPGQDVVGNLQIDNWQSILVERGVSDQELFRLFEIYALVGSDLRDVLLDMHYVESRYDSLAVSFGGDCGIGQINPRWWSGRNFRDFLVDLDLSLDLSFNDVVFSAEMCVLYSEWILRKLLDKSGGDIRLALKYYNGSWDYVDKVLGLRNE